MNIVFIMSDQQNKRALGKVNPQYITPNLDMLANDGVLFYNAYTPSPVCVACRACLMTGKYTSENGVRTSKDEFKENDLQLSEMMKNAGYNTAYVGKYHLGGGGNGPIPLSYRKGIDKMMAYQCYNGFKPEPPHNNQVIFRDENNEPTQFNYHRTDVTTDLALKFIEDLTKKDAPFFLMVSYQAPHYPEQPSDKYYDLYKNTTFTLPIDYQEMDLYTQTFNPPSIKPKENCPDYQRYGNDTQEYLRCYAGMCSQVDAGVGRIVELLKERGVYDDTVIFYTSDHGDMQGSKGKQNKQAAYEGSAGVPMIIKYPNGRQNEFSNELISVVDIYKTCGDIAGSAYKDNKLASKSILPYLQKKTDKTQDYIISECALNNGWKMIRSAKYKLITTYSYFPTGLYDMENDPNELNNILHNEGKNHNKNNNTDTKSIISDLSKVLDKYTQNTATNYMVIIQNLLNILQNNTTSY